MYVNITYDQKVSVTESKLIFEVRLAAVVSVSYVPLFTKSLLNNHYICLAK